MTFKMPIISKDEMAQRFHQNWREQNPDDNCLPDGSVDDCLTNLNWLQNLNIMTKFGAPTPETPPASPVPSPEFSGKGLCSLDKGYLGSSLGQSKSKTNTSKAILEDVDYKTNGSVKPPYSYATLICMAMKANKNKMTLSSIYKWIKENFMYYKNADPSWQNSIRHNLSLNKCFIKIPRSKDEPGKGGFWRLDPKYAESLVDGIFKKRRPAQRQAGGGATSKKSRKDKAKEAQETMSRMLETFQHDTPPSSAESIVSNGDLDLMSEMKSMPMASSPSQTPFTYAAVTSGICEYPNEAILSHSQNPQPQRPQVQQQHIVHPSEALMILEPITHELAPAEIHAAPVNNGNNTNGLFPGSMCWNEVLDPDIELDSLYKYRPEDSISTVVNTALALNDDLFSSDGSSPDLPSELDLTCPDHLDIGGVSGSNNNPPSNDWLACFQHNPLDVALTPLLSISVPFNNPQPPMVSTPANVALNGNAVNSGVVNGIYSQNSMCSTAFSMVADRQLQLPDPMNQPWSEYKAVLEAAALEIDDLADLDAVHAY